MNTEAILPGEPPYLAVDASILAKGGTSSDALCLIIPFTAESKTYEAVVRFAQVPLPASAEGSPTGEAAARLGILDLQGLSGMADGAGPAPDGPREPAPVAVSLAFRHPRPGSCNPAVPVSSP